MKLLRPLTPFAATLLLVVCPHAFGLGVDYTPGAPIAHPDTWPQRLVELANLSSRVAGYSINADDSIAFTGDTTGFRKCIETCVALAEFAPATLHIHKGKGAFQPLDKAKKPVPCDWRLDVINQHWRQPQSNRAGPKYTFELHVWLDGAVDLAAVKLPPTIKTLTE